MKSRRLISSLVSLGIILVVFSLMAPIWRLVVTEEYEISCAGLQERECATLIANTVTPPGDRVDVTAGAIQQAQSGARIVQFAVQTPVQLSVIAQDQRGQQAFGQEFVETLGWTLRLTAEQMLWDEQIIIVRFDVTYPWGEQQQIPVPTWSLDNLSERGEKDIGLWFEQFSLAVADAERLLEAEAVAEVQLVNAFREQMGLPPRVYVRVATESESES